MRSRLGVCTAWQIQPSTLPCPLQSHRALTVSKRVLTLPSLPDLAPGCTFAMIKPSSPTSAATHRLRIGPAGWAYNDWNSYVYPMPRPKGFHEATFLAQFFDTIEINASFYQPIRPDHAPVWLERVATNPNFVFTAKLWQKFTHDPSATPEDELAVRAGFDVLRKAGKLGAVLAQFPFSFHHSNDATAYLTAVLKRFADYPLVVELRHASWHTPKTLDLLRQFHVGFCNIDQPLIGRSLPPSAEVTSSVGYVRLHGRRYDTWFSDDPNTPSHERYNYLYSADELDPWIERIRSINQHTGDTFVVTNNHFQGKAVVNALQLLSTLKGTKVKVPEPLRQHFPQLEQIASERPSAPTLFPMGVPQDKKS